MLKFIFFGITQGLTEFLPVSSSGHLFFLQRLLNTYASGIKENTLFFFIFLHIATLFAVLLFLSKNLKLLLDKKILTNIIVITIVSGSVGGAMYFGLSKFFTSKYLLAFCFLTNAIILLTIKKGSPSKTCKDIGFKDSLFIGILQGISFLPGISRSGITITGLIKRGFKREEAFILSFLMAIPAMLGVFAVELLSKHKELAASNYSFRNMSLGFLSALICGILALKLVRRFLVTEKFRNFAYYCLLMAIISLIV